MSEADRLLAPTRKSEDVDATLRPKSLDDFVGQTAAREKLRVFVVATQALRKAARHGALDHGPRRAIFAA